MILIQTKITEVQPAEMAVRKWREILRAAHEAEGRYWARVLLPRHFLPSARFRYGYQPRSGRYLKQKLRSGHGMVDLVYSGRMKEYLGSTAQIRGFPSRVTITMFGPQYVTPNPMGKRARMPNLAQEALAVTDDERRELVAVLEETFRKQLEDWRESRTTEIQ